MIKKILLIGSLAVSGFAFAQNNMQQYIQASEKCPDLNCVRSHIDNIDSKLVILLGERLAYVKRAGELKASNVSVHDQARENKVLDKVAAEAEAFGYPGAIARVVFTALLGQTNIYEGRFKVN